MARVLPALGSPRNINVLDSVWPGKNAYLEHQRAVVEDQHYVVCYRRRSHAGQCWPDPGAAGTDPGDVGTASTELAAVQYLIWPLAHATTLRVTLAVRVRGGGGTTATVTVNLINDNTGAVIDTWVQTFAPGLSYDDDVLTPIVAGTLYRVSVDLDADTADVVDLLSVQVREEDLTAGELAAI